MNSTQTQDLIKCQTEPASNAKALKKQLLMAQATEPKNMFLTFAHSI